MSRTRSSTVLLATASTLLLGLPATLASAAGTASTAADVSPGVSCSALVGVQIPASAIGLPTTGGTVSQATTQNTTAGTPYCKPTLLLHPVDPKAPDITAQMGLPDSWGGRAMMFGGGGYDGSVPAPDGQVPFGAGTTPLDRGMVTYASDSGHTNSPTSLPTLDGSFGVNDEALHNFAGDALKKTHDAAMFLLARYYPSKTTPDDSYFAGGSSGGREALGVAQRWPQDFNGVIAVYPAYNAATLDLFFGFEARELSKPDAFPNPTQQKLLYQSVVNACDGLDGASDGVIGDEAGCHYDPAALRCPNGVNANSCLTDAMIAAVKKLSAPIHFDYPLASGETSYPGFPFLSGADMTAALLGMGSTPPAEPEPQTAGYGPQFWGQFVKYIVTRDPNYNNLSLDPFAPGVWQQRISDLTKFQDINDPNLAPFADRGGKLLMVHGTADELVSHRSTVDYYQRIQKTMGAARARDFSRLYMVPGANHANIGGAYTANWDSVTPLEDWVRDGKVPGPQMVADGTSVPPRTRPLCEYTSFPQYVSGDVNQAGSFSCRAATPVVLGTPASPSPSTSPSATATATAAPSASASATASAAPSASSPSPATSQRLGISVTPAVITPGLGVTVTVSGKPGTTVELQAYSRPNTTYRQVRTGIVSSAGTLEFRVTPGTNTRLFAHELNGDSRNDSPSTVINVQTALSLTVVRNGRRDYTFKGRILPRRSGQLITLYRVDNGRRIITKQIKTDSTGTYTIHRVFTGSGRFGFLTHTGQNLTNAASDSNSGRARPTDIF